MEGRARCCPGPGLARRVGSRIGAHSRGLPGMRAGSCGGSHGLGGWAWPRLVELLRAGLAGNEGLVVGSAGESVEESTDDLRCGTSLRLHGLVCSCHWLGAYLAF